MLYPHPDMDECSVIGSEPEETVMGNVSFTGLLLLEQKVICGKLSLAAKQSTGSDRIG